jgi:hypothetical protein
MERVMLHRERERREMFGTISFSLLLYVCTI